MLPFLHFHALAALRGDGLRPELLALFERLSSEHNSTVTELAPMRAARLASFVPRPVSIENAVSPGSAVRAPSTRNPE